MYVRAKTVRHRDRSYEYLQLVEARREAGRNRQRVIATLGRLDQVCASGQLDRLIAGLARFSERLRVVSVERDDALAARNARSWGPALVFGRLWEGQGLPASWSGCRGTGSSGLMSSGWPSPWPCSG